MEHGDDAAKRVYSGQAHDVGHGNGQGAGSSTVVYITPAGLPVVPLV